MKKTFLICAGIAMLLCLQGVLAITTDLKTGYLQGETVITEIRGNVIGAIESGNVELRRGHVLVPVEFEIRKLGEDYFLWFITPKSEQNYTLIIKNIPSTVEGQIEEVTYAKNFSTSANLSIYTIKPGFVYTDRDFEINIQLNEDNDRDISLMFMEEINRSTTLKPGENVLSFSIKGIEETGLLNLSIDNYNMPVYVKLNKTVHNIFVNESVNLTNENATLLILNISEQKIEEISNKTSQYHCYEYEGGRICEANQFCTGRTVTSADGACCVMGECISPIKEGGSYAWIGYLLAAVVIISGVVVYLRYRKIREEKNPITKRVQEIEKRKV